MSIFFKNLKFDITIVAVILILGGLTYMSHLKDKVKDLKINNGNLKTEIKVKEVDTKNKVFEVKQQAKKQQIVKQLKKEENASAKNSEVSLSIGNHSISF